MQRLAHLDPYGQRRPSRVAHGLPEPVLPEEDWQRWSLGLGPTWLKEALMGVGFRPRTCLAGGGPRGVGFQARGPSRLAGAPVGKGDAGHVPL